MRYYMGIDPGLNGSVAVFEESGKFHSVHDLPTKEQNKKRIIDAEALFDLFLNFKVLRAYIEQVHAMPMNGTKSNFSLGHSTGVIEGVLSACEIPYGFILPNRWKSEFRLKGKEKDMSRHKAMELIPGTIELLKRKKDIDRAEAMLIGLCGMGH